MRIFRKLILTAVAGVALLASPAVAEPTEVQAGLMMLEFPEMWKAIQIPGDEVDSPWIFVTNVASAGQDQPTEEKRNKKPEENEAKGKDQAIFFVDVVPKDGRTLDDLNSQTRKYISKLMDGVLEYERSTTVDGSPAHLFVYEGRSEHYSDQGRRKFMRVLTSRGNDFYVLHGVADHIPFATYAGSMEKIVNSAEWK